MGSSINLSQLAIPASQEDSDFQRRSVADLLGRQTLHFPGAQPVSFARHHLQELREVDYFMCEKTDGIRCLLYLTLHTDPGGEPVEAQYLIDRKNDYYYIRRDTLHIPRAKDDLGGFHTGTLLDGELVRQRQKQPPHEERIVYLIFDCLATDGENIMNKDFSRRLARIDNLIVQPLKVFRKEYKEALKAQPQTFQVEMKKMEFPYGFVMMFDHVLPALPHGNDGLIFTCKDTLYVSGTDDHVLKWKPPEENTVDFRLILGEFPKLTDAAGEHEDYDSIPEMELWVNHGKNDYRPWATLHVTESEWNGMKNLHQQLDGRIIEAYRDGPLSDAQSKEVWRPKVEKDGSPRFRDDKKDANHITVVNSVLESIRDAVSEQDLKDAGYAIRKAFKERQAERERREAEERRRAEEERRRAEEMNRRRKETELRRREELARRERERESAGNAQEGREQDEEEVQRPAEPMEEDEMDDGPTYDEDDD